MELRAGPAGGSAAAVPVPQILNIDHGIFVVENLDLEQLAADGVRRFALILDPSETARRYRRLDIPIALI